MTKTFTLTEVAKAAIQDYRINSGEPTAVLDRVSKKIKRYVEGKYGKGTEITEEIKNDINSWSGLSTYFKDQAERDWKGKKYFEALADKMTEETEEWVQGQFSVDSQDPTIKEIEHEINQNFENNKMALMDKIMFKTYLFTDDNNYKEDYKIIIQNNFGKDILSYAKKEFFNKYFDTKLFSDDFINYFNRYDDPFNVRITPEMAEAVDRLGQDNNYKEYLKK